MKLSLYLQDDRHQNQKPLIKAKLPISLFDQPFTSIVTTATNSFSDLSFSLSTNFPSGPSLKLAYSPSSTAAPISPFSLTLKSGLGLFGSPHKWPLIFSAHFSVSNTSPNVIIPTFSLHFKPQLGHFSLHKKTASLSNPNPDPKLGSHLAGGSYSDSGSPSNSEFGYGFVPEGPSGWQELKLEPCTGKEKEGFANPDSNAKDGRYADNNGIGFLPDRQLGRKDGKQGGFLSGVAVKANTVLPLTKRVMVNLRWGVNLPGDLRIKMPYLTVNKIGIERIEEEKEVKEKGNESDAGDLELLKGMCCWMRRDLEVLEKENMDMKKSLEDMRLGASTIKLRGERNGAGKKVSSATSESFGEFEQWRSKKNDREGNRQREPKKPANPVADLESELQKAIKAASS